MATHAPNKCRNCYADLTLGRAYPATCGQKIVSTRLTLHEVAEDLLHAFVHADRSILSLVRLLLVRPGTVALDYVHGKRNRYFGPFAFLGVIVAVASAAIVLRVSMPFRLTTQTMLLTNCKPTLTSSSSLRLLF